MAKTSSCVAALLSLQVSGCDGKQGLDCDWEKLLSSEPPRVPLVVTRSAEIDANTVVTMQRAGCFGACPVYSVRVGGDGSVEFSGESYVRVIGKATGQIPVADVGGLVGALLDANYLSMETGCGPGPQCAWFTTDASGATTSLTWNGQTRTIPDYHGNSCAPRVLRSIEDLIDEIAGTARWVMCDTPDGYCYSTSAELEAQEGG